ncbi:IS110 family RNA-guided transposase [Candidatus Lokiarchaeum ossiferum]
MSQNPSKTFRLHKKKCKSRGSLHLSSNSTFIEQIIRFGVGMDVHRDTVVVCICAQTAQNEIIVVKQHSFRNVPTGLQEMMNFLKKYRPISHYLMECTGIYHRPVYHALERAFPQEKEKIIAMNPLLVHRRLTDLGNKHDKADAQRMAELSFYDKLLRPSYVGDPQFFHLRDCLRSYTRSRQDSTRFKNRIHRVLCSIHFMYKFDLGKEWSLQILDYWIHHGGVFQNAFQALLLHMIEEGMPILILQKHSDDFAPFASVSLTRESTFNLAQLLQQFLEVERHAAQYLLQTEQFILSDAEFTTNYQALLTIPCMGPVSALQILTEVGDFRRFRDWRAFAKFCGVVPEIKESGSSINKGHVNRYTNAHLRRSLVQIANLIINGKASRTDLDEFATKQYHSRKLPFKKACMKVAFKLSRIVYNILVKNIQYDPHYEQTQQKMQKLLRRKARTGTLLQSAQVRALRKDIGRFFVNHHEHLNSKSRFLLTRGFTQMIDKVNKKDLNDKDTK